MAADKAHSNRVAREHAMLGESGLLFLRVKPVGNLEEVGGAIEQRVVIVRGHFCKDGLIKG